MSKFQQTAFHTTVAHLSDLPKDSAYEVAFVGRSNSGKSSAINTLTGRTRLAFVSKTPGRTQHLNYFKVADARYFVDLPGYGFAKAPDNVRREWEGLIAPFLVERPQLAGLVSIMDCRRPLLELDYRLLDWFRPTGRPIHIVLSKADKLSRQDQMKTLHAVQATLAAWGEPGFYSVQLFSSLKKTGVDELRHVLEGWLQLGAP